MIKSTQVCDKNKMLMHWPQWEQKARLYRSVGGNWWWWWCKWPQHSFRKTRFAMTLNNEQQFNQCSNLSSQVYSCGSFPVVTLATLATLATSATLTIGHSIRNVSRIKMGRASSEQTTHHTKDTMTATLRQWVSEWVLTTTNSFTGTQICDGWVHMRSCRAVV